MDALDSVRVLGRECCDDTRSVASICTECFEVRLGLQKQSAGSGR